MTTSSIAALTLNTIALILSLPVWWFGVEVLRWKGGSENWAAFMLFIVGTPIVVLQAVTLLTVIAVIILHLRRWTHRERLLTLLTAPAGILSSLLAFLIAGSLS